MLTTKQSQEWLSAADWCAARGITGNVGDALPMGLDAAVCAEIDDYQEEFRADVRRCAYARAMRDIDAREERSTP